MLKEFLYMLIILALVIEKISLNSKHNKIFFSSKISDRNVEIDELFTIQSSITNKRMLLMSNIELLEEFPKDITLKEENKDIEITESNVKFRSAFYLGRNERITFRLRASINKRGVYSIGSCILSNSDFLGLKKINSDKSDYHSIIVFPKRIECDSLNLALNNFYGDFIVRRQLICDPTFVMGYHEYTGCEPLRTISWKQTARRNDIIVKEYDYTQEHNVNVVLDVSYKNDFGYSHNNLELCFSIARVVCEFLENKQVPYTFLTNSHIEGNEEKVYTVNSTGNKGKTIANVLDILAACTYKQSCTYKEYIDYLSTYRVGNNTNCSIIYICTNYDESSYRVIEKMKITKNIGIYTFFAADYSKGDDINAC